MIIRPCSFAVILGAHNADKLLHEYAQECSIPEIGKINPQAEIYRKLEQSGAMRCLGVWNEADSEGCESGGAADWLGTSQAKASPIRTPQPENSLAYQSSVTLPQKSIVGFAAVLWAIIPHYGRKVATVESVFIAKAHRHSGAGMRLLEEIETLAIGAECVGILYSSPAGGRLEVLLDNKDGYRRTNSVFYKGFE